MRVKTPLYTLHCGDALEFLRGLPSDSVDAVFTDPPYSSLEKHRKVGSTTRLAVSNGSSNKWFPVMDNDVLLGHCAEMLRILKPGRHAYFMCDPSTSYDVLPLLLRQGWNWGNRLIWHKTGGFGLGYHYRRSYEDILFLWKGPKTAKRRLASASIPDLLPFPRLKGAQYWPTEKPSALIETLLRQSTEPGELVLDPFCGSGSAGEAALLDGCRFLGIDITAEAIRRSRERLSGLSEAPKPPTPAPEPNEAPEPVQAASAPKPKVRVLAPPQGMRPLFGRPVDSND
jgi:site-specific DNA-methyltransferase (adenine-specific)